MHQFKSDYLEHQLKRFMRPDAHRYIRPDLRRYVRPGCEDQFPFERFERKYNPDQPRAQRPMLTPFSARQKRLPHVDIQATI